MVAITNIYQLCDAILGLMRVSKFGTEHQTRNAAKGELFFDEQRILTNKADCLDIYSLSLIWQPSFIGVSSVEDGDVELVLMWESENKKPWTSDPGIFVSVGDFFWIGLVCWPPFLESMRGAKLFRVLLRVVLIMATHKNRAK